MFIHATTPRPPTHRYPEVHRRKADFVVKIIDVYPGTASDTVPNPCNVRMGGYQMLDAIFRMGRVLSRLEALDRELQRRPPYSVLGTGSLHASLISGGRELSTYPDRCTLQVERRTTSAEQTGVVLKEVEEILAALESEDNEFQCSAKFMFDRVPFETPKQHLLPHLLEQALQAAGQPVKRGGVSF